MRCKKILAAAVSLAMAASQFSVAAFAENNGENTDAASSASADSDTTGAQDSTTTNDEDKPYDVGDVNGNGSIDITDVVKTAAHIKSAKALSEKGLKAADINADGKVNITDLSLLAGHVKGKLSIDVYTKLPVVKNPREMPTDVKLIEFNVDKDTKKVSWNASSEMTMYNVQFSNGTKTKSFTTHSLKADIPYDMFADGKLTVIITPMRFVLTEDGERTKDYGDATGYLLKIKPDMIHGTITVTDSNGKAKIEWPAADFAAGYHVYDITNTTSEGKPKLIADTDTNQLITSFPTNGTVKMLIVPFNSVGEAEGVNAEMTSGTVTEPDPVADLAAPTFGSTFYYSDTDSATLIWNPVSGAEGYEVSIEISGKWVAYNTTASSYKFTGLASRTGFKTKVRAYKTVNGKKAYGNSSKTVTVITDGYVKCVTATPIYASADPNTAKVGQLNVGDIIMQTDLPYNGWTRVFLPNSGGTQTGYIPTSCVTPVTDTTTEPDPSIAAPTFNSYFYNSDTESATLMWNPVSGVDGYEASIEINGTWNAYTTTASSYKFTGLASCTGFKTRVRAYKNVSGKKVYGSYSESVTVVTDGYVKCVAATPIYASASTGSTKIGQIYAGDTVMQTDLPSNGWTKIFLPNSGGSQVGFIPTSCVSAATNTTTEPDPTIAAPTFGSTFYYSDTESANLIWNPVSGIDGYEASIQIDGSWKAFNTTNSSYKFTGLASRTGFKTRVRAYKTVNGKKVYSPYSETVTVITDGYIKCETSTPIYASASTGSAKIGQIYAGDTVLQTDLPSNGWTKIFLPNSGGTQVGFIPTSCVNTDSSTKTDPTTDLAAPTFGSYYYSSDNNSATIMWNPVSGAEGYEASMQIDGKWVAYNTTSTSCKFTGLAQRTGFNARVRAYKTVNGKKAYGSYSKTITAVTDGYVKCVTATPIYASESTGSSKVGQMYVGDIFTQTDLPSNGWTKVFLPNSNGTKTGFIPSSCVKNYANSGMTVISQDGYLGGKPAVLGCEETALASVLNYQFGINVSKNTLIDYYMPEQAFSDNKINVDPNYCFWGSPYHMEGSVGYGCYAPLIAQSANQYLKYIGEKDKYNITLNTDYTTGNNVNKLKFDPSKLDLGNTSVNGGLDIDGLKAELDKGNNPIVWYSEVSTYPVCTQTITAGQKYSNPGSGTYNFTWYGRQHTAVLTGYDDAKGCFILGNVENFDTSSYYGKVTTESYDFFMQTYTTLGRQSIVITKK